MAPPSITPSTNYRNSVRTRRYKLLASYAGDWLITIILGGLFIALQKIEGYRRRFSLDDESIQYPFAEHERVPDWLLIVIVVVAPIVLIPIIDLITVRSVYDVHNAELGLILSLALTGAITNVFKVTAGRPRPDLINRCLPAQGSQNPAVYGLVDYTICTQTDNGILQDGFRSLISGHASLSFAGLGFLSYYLCGKLHLWDERGHTGKAWLAVTPFIGSTLIAITRTMDFRHHATDVLFGALLGSIVSYFCYRQYFPTLTSPHSHLPFAPRLPEVERPAGPEEATGDAIPMTGQAGSADMEAGTLGRRRRPGEEPAVEEQNVEGTAPRNQPWSLGRIWATPKPASSA